MVLDTGSNTGYIFIALGLITAAVVLILGNMLGTDMKILVLVLALALSILFAGILLVVKKRK